MQNNTAVLVLHGMGQQVPFETVGNVAEKIRKRKDWEPLVDAVKAQTVSCNGGAPADATLSRIRMEINQDGAPRVVDFYESYWAPLTEGRVNSVDALKFLMNAGLAGIRLSWKGGFARQFWRSCHEFRLRTLWNIGRLLVTLLLVGSLALLGLRSLGGVGHGGWMRRFEELGFLFRMLHLIIAPTLIFYGKTHGKKIAWRFRGILFLVVLAAAVQAWALLLPDFFFPTRAFGRVFDVDDLFAQNVLRLIFCWDVFALVAAIALHLARRKQDRDHATLTGRIIWFQTPAAFAAVIGGGILCARVMLGQEPYAPGTLNTDCMIYLYGALGLVVLYGLRFFLIEYIGDLAAYLCSHEASKFSELRAQIQAEAFKVACHVYDPASGYDNVIVMGHSLGSVIAYDTLNGIISHDYTKQGGKWGVVERTKLLLTFGSPLDKTAFIFRAQVKGNPLREVLAAGKQPLLDESHAYRPRNWVNVWSPCDIISARLDYYDCGETTPYRAFGGKKSYLFKYHPFSAGAPKGPVVDHFNPQNPPPAKVSPVVSLIDPQADIPFAAHTQFWDNKLIYDVLVNALLDKGNGTSFAKFLKVT